MAGGLGLAGQGEVGKARNVAVWGFPLQPSVTRTKDDAPQPGGARELPMTAASPQPTAFDSMGMIEKIQGLLNRSSVFRGAQISLPQTYPGGEVSVAVGFGGGTALFRIVAPSVEKAYAVLYEFAHSLVEMENRRHRRRLA